MKKANINYNQVVKLKIPQPLPCSGSSAITIRDDPITHITGANSIFLASWRKYLSSKTTNPYQVPSFSFISTGFSLNTVGDTPNFVLKTVEKYAGEENPVL